MKKYIIVFNCRLKLWDFKQILSNGVLQTILWKRSITCVCTEEEIELALHAYDAKVEEVK